MNVAILLLLVILSGGLNGQFDGDQCPNVEIDLSRKPINASSTCGDSKSSTNVQYCYKNATTGVSQCRTCENEEDVSARNVLNADLTSYWVSRPGVEAVNLTVDLVQVCVGTEGNNLIIVQSDNYLRHIIIKLHKVDSLFLIQPFFQATRIFILNCKLLFS